MVSESIQSYSIAEHPEWLQSAMIATCMESPVKTCYVVFYLITVDFEYCPLFLRNCRYYFPHEEIIFYLLWEICIYIKLWCCLSMGIKLHALEDGFMQRYSGSYGK